MELNPPQLILNNDDDDRTLKSITSANFTDVMKNS